MTNDTQQLRERTVDLAEEYPHHYWNQLASDWQSAYDRDMAAKDAEIARLREALQEMRYGWTDKALRMADEALAKTDNA